MRLWLRAVSLLTVALPLRAAADPPRPWLDHLVPLGAQQGQTITLDMYGQYLSNIESVWFDCEDLAWEETLSSSSGKITGRLRVAPGAALGPHLMHIVSRDGRSNSRLFNVIQFPSIPEAEPNSLLEQAQGIVLRPQIIDGNLTDLADIDMFRFTAAAGERWTFDLRSMEYGSHLEAKMLLLDAAGNVVTKNDDRDDYSETPYIEHTFAKAGEYVLMLDQYRGPQRVDCAENCGYMLQISQLPLMQAASPLGGRVGETVRMSVVGTALDAIEGIYLTAVRAGEYYRMTYPYTVKIDARKDPPTAAAIPRIDGRILTRGPDRLEAEFAIPGDAPAGLWRLWGKGPAGVIDNLSIEITAAREVSESQNGPHSLDEGDLAINGQLTSPGEEDVFRFQARKGEPLHFWTVATQLGLPYLDTVLEVRDTSGKILAEHDDLMSGQGTVIGNTDSSLVYVPEADGEIEVSVRDRTSRGGPTYAYRLRARKEHPGFDLLVDLENFAIPRGGKAEMGVLLIREPGFEGAPEVWIEGLPDGIQAGRAAFRADQFFGPSADGDNIIIPEAPIQITVDEGVVPGTYPIRVLGREGPDGTVVQAHTSLWIGPPRKRNDVRRPLPSITVTVVEPFEPRLTLDAGTVRLNRGGGSELTVKAEHISETASFELRNAPTGLTLNLTGREENQLTFRLEAAEDLAATESEVSVETRIDGRWAATAPFKVTVADREQAEVSR